MKFIFLSALLLSAFVAQSSWAVCVSVKQANLRAGPSTSAKKLWTVGQYMPFIALEQKGAWVKVKDLDGEKMWIYANLLSDDMDCMVIKVSKANLRKGPGTNHPQTPLSFAHKYMPFKKLRRDGAWLLIEDDHGFKHWVVENNIWEPLEYTRVSY